jgi:hypothetical protein
MKKVLLAAILLAASTLVGIGATVTPAEAVTCTFRETEKTVSTWAGTGGDANWDITMRVDYRTCVTETYRYARVSGISVKIVKTRGDCGSGFGPPIDYWRINPDTVAGWNPGSKTTDCPGTTHTVYFDAPPNQDALPGDTANVRCVSGYITAVRPQANDNTRDLPIICII